LCRLFFSSLLAAIQNSLAQLDEPRKYKLSVMNMMDPGFPFFLESANLDCGIMLGRTSLENINLLKSKIPNLVYAGSIVLEATSTRCYATPIALRAAQ